MNLLFPQRMGVVTVGLDWLSISLLSPPISPSQSFLAAFHARKSLGGGGVASLSLQLRMTLITDSLRFLIVGHRRLFGRAIGAENLTTISTMVLAIGEREWTRTTLTLGYFRVVGPFPPRLFSELHLKDIQNSGRTRAKQQLARSYPHTSTWERISPLKYVLLVPNNCPDVSVQSNTNASQMECFNKRLGNLHTNYSE